ncbi:MAG: phytoene/squalene synthase family protein [Bacteroidetes bacterium]|nr:phytoene/squalene synthase family protein [Bacteroidota bacterium]MBS1976405.1 phytoene/squalene synthase family protein [Bacteroidota bacterium]
MSQKNLFDEVSIRTSRLTTHAYSTSFSLGIRCLDKTLRDPIYSIYGFVRFADEIVDTFHDYNKAELLQRFRHDTWTAIQERISLNPILNSFQQTVHRFNIDASSIEQFLHSMELDLTEKKHSRESFDKYVLGSAEVVGLMCLRIFCDGNEERYQALKPAAMKLGSAFQKVNFIRDLHADYDGMGRLYFPGVQIEKFDQEAKKAIEAEIEEDFRAAYQGIKELPRKARLGVYVAYLYYMALFRKIKALPCESILKTRIRIRNRYKIAILGLSYLKHQLNLIR